VTRAPTDRSHLSIGEVLSLLQEEFPDVTISKIRFLESQGLLDPERTPSGYRKFYEGDIDRLRWILRQQKDHYLPLKVIKDRLDDATVAPAAGQRGPSGRAANGGTSATAGSRDGVADPDARTVAVVLEERPGGRSPAGEPLRAVAPAAAATTLATAPRPGQAADPRRAPTAGAASPVGARGGDAGGGSGQHHAGRYPGVAAAVPPAAGTVSLTAEELAQQSGLTLGDLRDLERYGLIESFAVGDAAYYDGDALLIAQTAAGFLQHGIEARHMRTYRVAIDREAGLFEQLVLPLLKQRNPAARQRARETITELVRLGQQMRAVLLSRALRDVT
jgi:DNA-binding transcriptional MerR regulator